MRTLIILWNRLTLNFSMAIELHNSNTGTWKCFLGEILDGTGAGTGQDHWSLDKGPYIMSGSPVCYEWDPCLAAAGPRAANSDGPQTIGVRPRVSTHLAWQPRLVLRAFWWSSLCTTDALCLMQLLDIHHCILSANKVAHFSPKVVVASVHWSVYR